jgi:hypothetical protein
MHKWMGIRNYAQKADQHSKHPKGEGRGDGIDIRNCFEELADCSRQKRGQAFTYNLDASLEEHFRDHGYYTD